MTQRAAFNRCFDLSSRRYQYWHDLSQVSHDINTQTEQLLELMQLEHFWAYPGPEVLSRLCHYQKQGAAHLFQQLASNVLHQLDNQHYRRRVFEPFRRNITELDQPRLSSQGLQAERMGCERTYFEVLVVHPDPLNYEAHYRQQLAAFISDRDEFCYDILFVASAEAAYNALLANPILACCVMVAGFPVKDAHSTLPTPDGVPLLDNDIGAIPLVQQFSQGIRCVRPELERYLIHPAGNEPLDIEFAQDFERVLFHENPFQDLHFALLNGIRERFSTPFFHALQAYSRKPKGVFHALPLSRGQSVSDSPWIHDMLDFYGKNIFLAETSSTQGGLDSLLDPKGAIKQAHEKTARCFGAEHSYFVTNGTSTSNKIVMQSLLSPGDLVLISSDCHKSIPYSAMLTGALPIFLETYPLPEYDLYGAVTLNRIKQVMLDLRRQGQLHRLRQITLTNATFDGLIYNTERFMMEVLAIKPDLIVHWDEAWFAFAHFNPVYHGRTAMTVAKRLQHTMASSAYRKRYQAWQANFDADDDEAWQNTRLLADPDQVVVRMYATQSTHKTLTAFRQGSMVHVHDAHFDEECFLEAFRIHTSTSPNYQILASLDIGRRQMALEGFERTQRAIRLAMRLRDSIRQSDRLQKFFQVLGDTELVADIYRDVANPRPSDSNTYADIKRNWQDALFVVDPTRITLDIKRTGMDGSSFRQLLINRYDIQVNKTSRHTVLFIVHIGATEQSIDYLLSVLHEIAERLMDGPQATAAVTRGTEVLNLPQRRYFHPIYQSFICDSCDVADMRLAYYDGYRAEAIEYIPLNTDTIKAVLDDLKLVSASFVTPYPPGFPLLVPGQLITYDILNYLHTINIKEIHGYQAEYGLKVFTQAHLDSK